MPTSVVRPQLSRTPTCGYSWSHHRGVGRGLHTGARHPRTAVRSCDVRLHRIAGDVPRNLLPACRGEAGEPAQGAWQSAGSSGGVGVGVGDAGGDGESCGPAGRVGGHNLLAAVLANTFGAMERLTAESRRRTPILRIRASIPAHLNNSELTPRTIAAAHHISPSNLHRRGVDDEETVAAWTRVQRLDAHPPRPRRGRPAHRRHPRCRRPPGLPRRRRLQPCVPRHVWCAAHGIPAADPSRTVDPVGSVLRNCGLTASDRQSVGGPL